MIYFFKYLFSIDNVWVVTYIRPEARWSYHVQICKGIERVNVAKFSDEMW